ncbi:MAG: 16S rRNA (guanine(966)-N(2))-methyltransferase RsmD, partial [Candidatus Rokuibacteriota bacterium]
MRVLAGALKGQRLTTPRGRTTRPTADQVRIACLDTLMPFLDHGPFLDLFAGAGGVGIEALSRGAPSAVFVEQDAAALRALRDNVERLGLAGQARVMRADAARAVALLEAAGERFAVVFLDPPY